MTATIDAHKETLSFQTEAKQILSLMIHALYSNQEIFLRELVSNASDACDKLRFLALTDDALFENNSHLTIQIGFNKEARTVTIRDNGIGMSRDEVIDHIGTIAKSGTKKFIESLTGDQSKDASLIGQFGVGFYSAFMVADKVTLVTRRAGLGAEHGVRWESDGEGSYSIETVDKATRGTEVILHMREGQDEYLDNYRLRHIIRKYSDHVSLPILMAKEGADGEEESVNQASALWARPKKDITDSEYNEFYKHISHDFEDPLAHVHSHVEGAQSYVTLFYVPARAPYDLWDRERRQGVKLYVKRVFIMDDSASLMPDYLRFVRGIVDSADLPLNVSREILQKNRHIDAIRAASVKKVLGLFESLKENEPEKYRKFWQEFGRVIKEGPGEDHANRDRIAKLLCFASTHSDTDEQTASLQDYVSRMKPGQNKIYFITAESFAAAKHSPHLEIFRKLGVEVLLMSDRVDEWMISHLNEFDGKSLQSVAKGDLDLGGIEGADAKDEKEKVANELTPLVQRIKEALGDRVADVRVTHRLTNSPTCLVVGNEDMAVNVQRLLKAAGHAISSSKPTLEINPTHALVLRLDKETDEKRFADWSAVLLDQAVLAEGGQLDDPAGFVNRLNALLVAVV